jgi:tRNA dimethylallyltransferase
MTSKGNAADYGGAVSGSQQSKRLVVVGPTASGKSSLAMAVATLLSERGVGAEIVCVDSMTVYNGLDIGTAKASLDDQMLVPHHCIDLVDPDVEYSVADFQRVALASIANIESRGCVPILVGGTGLYVDAVVNELNIPAQFPEVKVSLQAELAAGASIEELHARLVTLDPIAAARMEPNNERRIVRALEVCIGSGHPFSSFGPGLVESARTPGAGSHYAMVGLEWDRPALIERIEARLAAQFDEGFLEEATALLEHYGESLSRTVKQALGYRELWEFLDDLWMFDETLENIATRTRQFAVRQQRWFRRNPAITWLDGTDSISELVTQTLGVLTE